MKTNKSSIEFKKNKYLPIFQVFTILFILVTILGFHQINYTIPSEKVDKQAFFIFIFVLFPLVVSSAIYIIITSTKSLIVSPNLIKQTKSFIWKDIITSTPVSDAKNLSIKTGNSTAIIIHLRDETQVKIETLGLDESDLELSEPQFSNLMPNDPRCRLAQKIAFNISQVTQIPFHSEYINL